MFNANCENFISVQGGNCGIEDMIKCLLCVPVIKIFMVEVNLYNIYLETKAEIEIGPVFFC